MKFLNMPFWGEIQNSPPKQGEKALLLKPGLIIGGKKSKRSGDNI
jgi:hypothetical protein